MSLTLATLRQNVYDMLRELDADATSVYSPEFVNRIINAAQYRICAGMVIDATGSAVKKLKLPFLLRQQFYQNIGSTSLTEDATAGGATLTVSDTTDFPSTGTLWVNNNIIPYTGKTATTFTGCSDVALAWQSGSRVYPIYALPEDFMNTVGVAYNNAGPLEYVDELEIYQIVNNYKVGSGFPNYTAPWVGTIFPRVRCFYTIFLGTYFAPFFLDNNTGQFNLTYEALPTSMTDDWDTTVILNDELAMRAICNIATADILFDRAEEERALRKLQYGIGAIRELYSFYNKQSSEDQIFKSIRSGKGTGRNF